MGLVVGVNYVWCLVIIVIFMRFGESKRWQNCVDALKSTFGVAMKATREWGQLLW